MRADTHRAVGPCAMALALLACAIAGCRTGNVAGSVDRDPELKAILGPAETTEIAALPQAAGKALVAERCLMCHSAALITQQRKDAAAWGRTVTQMRTWGTPIADDDQTAIVTYLAEHFGTSRPPFGSSSSPVRFWLWERSSSGAGGITRRGVQ